MSAQNDSHFSWLCSSGVKTPASRLAISAPLEPCPAGSAAYRSFEPGAAEPAAGREGGAGSLPRRAARPLHEPGQEPLPAAEIATSAETLLILPFENAGRDPKLAWIGEGLAELFIERLAGGGRLAFARNEWQAAVEKLGLPPSASFSRATMLRIAKEVDADYVVFGSYLTDGRTLSVTARVLRAAPPALSSALVESGKLEDLMEVQAWVGWQVLRFLDPQLPESRDAYVRRFAQLRLDAFEHYVRGLLASDDRRIQFFREAARLEPEWADPAFALGQAYFEMRAWEAALIWFSRVNPAHTRGIEAAFYAGLCHLMRNDAPRAESAFATARDLALRLSARQADLPEVLNNLAVAQSRQGNWPQASAHWQRAQQLDPEEADYWFNHGLGALRAGDYSAAAGSFREALRHRSNEDDARALLVEALARAGRASEAASERESCANNDCAAAASAAVRAALSKPRRPGTRPPPLLIDALARADRISMTLDIAALRHVITGPPRAPAGGKMYDGGEKRPEPPPRRPAPEPLPGGRA
jgi:tetratricopeptide (TPR) repeat protein